MPPASKYPLEVQLHVNANELTVVDHMSRDMGITRSQFIRDAIANYIEVLQASQRLSQKEVYHRAIRLLNLKEEASQ